MYKWKRLICIVVLASFSSTLFAVDFHRKGETYTFKQDMQCFTLDEAKKTLQDLKSVEAYKQKIAIMETLISDYDKQAASFRASIAMHEEASKQYKESIQALRDSTQEYKNAATIYKDVIGVQADALKFQTQQANRNTRTRRWERNISFLLGFAAPVMGAWSVGRIGNIIK